MSKHVLIFLGFVRVVIHQALTRIWVKLAWCVPYGDVLFRRCITMTFLRVQVQQLRTLHVLHLSENTYQLLHVMSIEWTEVANVHTLEDVLLVRDGTLKSIRQSDDTLTTVIAEHAFAVHPARSLESDGVIGLVGAQVQQILLHTTHRTVDRHVVIIQDNQQVVGRRRYIVQTLKSQSATQRTVTDNRHHMAICIAFQLCSHSHTQCCRYGVAGMTTGKRVVFALRRRWEGFDASQLTVGTELLAPSCQNLMAVSLMAHVPHNTIFRGIINIMECNGNLRHAKTRC